MQSSATAPQAAELRLSSSPRPGPLRTLPAEAVAAAAPHTSLEELDLLTASDVAALFKVKVSWVYDQVQARRLPALRLGGGRTLRFRYADLAAYLSDAL